MKTLTFRVLRRQRQGFPMAFHKQPHRSERISLPTLKMWGMGQ